MTQPNSPPNSRRQRLLLSLVVALATLSGLTHAQDNGSVEHAQLASLLRQLDTIEATANQAEQSSQASAARYRFDFARLRIDIARIRTGIEDYLTPRRAQPREPSSLNGNYTSDTLTQ